MLNFDLNDFLFLQFEAFLLVSLTLILIKLLKKESAAFRFLILNSSIYLMITLPLFFLIDFEFKVNTSHDTSKSLKTLFSIKDKIMSHFSIDSEPNVSSFFSLDEIFLYTCFIIIAVLFIRLLHSYIIMFKLKQNAFKVNENHDLFQKAIDLKKELSLEKSVAIAWTKKSHTPFVWGVFNPFIIFPIESRSWSNEKMEHVLLHEFAHIKRNDFLTNMIYQFTSIFFFLNPLYKYFSRKLDLEREKSCDEMVLSTGKLASDYASDLLEIARGLLTKRLENNMISFTKKKDFRKRLEHILNMNYTNQSFGKINLIKYLLLLLVFFSPIFALNLNYAHDRNSFVPNLNPLKDNFQSVTSDYGEKQFSKKHKLNKFHKGIDLKAKIGTNVYAAASGTIIIAAEKGNYGLMIKISHEDEIKDYGFKSSYAHLSELFVKEKQFVKKGELIGKTGNSGLSTGPHLHFQIEKDNKTIDPKTFWRKN